MAFRVGLTGGIGSGKSKAADFFSQLGAAVIDTDAIAHELTGPGGAAMGDIERAFGQEYLREDGSLDRARMRALVFSTPQSKRRLEAILHPLIRQVSLERVASARTPYSVLVVPLLFETGSYLDLLDRVLVIDCDEARQIARTMARSKLDEDEVRRIMSAQISREARLAAADDVIVNDADIATLKQRVAVLHRQYLHAAASAP